MTTNLNIHKVIEFAEKIGYLIEKEYCIGRECIFLELRSRIFKKPFLLHVPEKYSILHSERQGKVIKLKVQGKKKSALENFQIEEGEDFIKLMVEQQVNNDQEMTPEEFDIMSKYIKKIDRFKECLKSTNYSLAYVAPEGICYLNSKRSYECFICVLSRPNEYGRLLIVSDLATFYSKKVDLESDLVEMFRGIHEISHRLRSEQVNKILRANQILNKEFQATLAQVKLYQEKDDDKIAQLTKSSHKIHQAREKVAERKKNLGSGKKISGLVNTLHSNLDNILELDTIEKEEERIRQVDHDLAGEVDKYNEDIFTLWELSEGLIVEYSQQILALKTILKEYQSRFEEKTLCLT